MFSAGVFSVPGSPGHGIAIFRPGGDRLVAQWYCHDLQGRPFWLQLTNPNYLAANTATLQAKTSRGVAQYQPFGTLHSGLRDAGTVTLSAQGDELVVTYDLLSDALGQADVLPSPLPPGSIQGELRMTRLL